jgi:Holliday junction resolvase-like predicted endonuclease
MLATSLESFQNLGRSTEEVRHRKAKDFERAVAEVLSSFGFKIISNVMSPVGEIDVLAGIHKLILVVECKSPTFKIDPRKFISDFKESQEWAEKLEKKVLWVKSNQDSLLERITRRKRIIRSDCEGRHRYSEAFLQSISSKVGYRFLA